MASLLLASACLTAAAVRVSNVLPRTDQHGAIVNSHEGNMYHFSGTAEGPFWWIGVAYPPCVDECAACNASQACCTTQGNTLTLLSSTDLVAWTLQSANLLPADVLGHVNYLPSLAYSAAAGLYVLTWVDSDAQSRGGTLIATAPHPAGPWSVSAFVKLKLPPSSTVALYTDAATGTGYLRYNAAQGVLQPPMNTSGAAAPFAPSGRNDPCDLTGYWYSHCGGGGLDGLDGWSFLYVQQWANGSLTPGAAPNYWASPWDAPIQVWGAVNAAAGTVHLSSPLAVDGVLQAAGPGAPACSRVAWAAPLASCIWCRDPWCNASDIAPAAQAHVLEELAPDYLATTGRYATLLTRPIRPMLEGGGMAAAGGRTIYATGADCCQCPQGSDAQVFGTAVGASPLSEYKFLAQLNPPLAPASPDCQLSPGCRGSFTVPDQMFGIVDAGQGASPRLMYYGERYNTGNGSARYSAQFTTLLPFDVGQPLAWVDEFNFTAAARRSPPPAGPSVSSLTSLITSVPPQGPLFSGQSIRVSYSGAVTAGDAANLTHARLVPFLDGAQYGAEVGFTGVDAQGQPVGEAFIPLPWWSTSANHSLVLAYVGDPVNGATLGLAIPTGALVSAAVEFQVTPRVPRRPHSSSGLLLTMYFETWYTPVNFWWQNWWQGPSGAGLAEAIPAIGRYASYDPTALRAQAAQLIQAGVDALVVDWTNNCWLPACSSWANRSVDTQQIVNATGAALAAFHSLRVVEGWSVPRFIILLALDNGGNTPLPALLDELDYIANAFLANATIGGADSFVLLEGKPLVLIFDALGGNHTGFAHGNFTIRFMASQLQSTPDFAARGFWSWMDASSVPILTRNASDAAVVEAAVLEPAYFASGGWLDNATAVGRSGGLTLLAELSSLLAATIGNATALPLFVNVCQWNEFSGTPAGRGAPPLPPGYAFMDSYSPDLSNDLEPTSPWAPAYQRPGNVRAGGGYGYSGLNALALLRAALEDPSAADGSAAVFIVAPAVGTLSNYTMGKTIEVSFVVADFSLARLHSGQPFLANVSLPVAVAVDGALVTVLPAPAAAGLQTLAIDTSALDARFPHVLSVTAQPPAAGSLAHLTRWPLSFDFVDADTPGGVPLAQPVPARGTAWLWLPESQA
jgi:hypothetical protein